MQSLMTEQSPSATYSQGGRGQLPNAAMYNAGSSMLQQNGGMQSSGQPQPSSSHGYDQHSQSQGRIPTPTSMQMQQAYQYQQQQQQQQQLQHQNRPVSPVMTFPEFVVQVQRFDRNALLELMWNQRNTLLQWQRRVQQLEAQLSSRYSFGSSGASSPYYSGTPPGAQPYGPSVPSNLSSEAEMARAAMRRNDRVGAQQYSQQPQYAAGGSPMTGGSPSGQASGAVNPGLYWEKVRSLKDAHAQNLYVAHRALSQHTAPANSAQGIKAENVKHNITLTMNVLSEPPKSIQPRPFEVLHSIERFIQNTIIPIVQKVQQQQQSGSQTPQQSSAATGLPGYASSNVSASPSVSMSYSAGNADAPQSASNAGAARLYAPSPSTNTASQDQAAGGTTTVAQIDSPTASSEGSTPVTAAVPGGSVTAATGAVKPPVSSAKGKKVKSEAAGAPKIPPRAKQSAVEGKAPPKRLSKAAEAKLAAQQQQPALLQQHGFQSQQQAQQTQQAAAQAESRAADTAGAADGHQSPFGIGANSFDKLSTPTVSPSENRAMVSAEDSVKTMALDAASKSASASAAVDEDVNAEDDDALNDFSDFPELDFDEEMPSMKIQFNKENSAVNAKKRSIGDV